MRPGPAKSENKGKSSRSSKGSKVSKSTTMTQSVVAAWLAGACFAAPAALAATDSAGDEARARYQQQRALCDSGLSPQDRGSCLREAGAALEEARRGRLAGAGDEARFRRNAVARCQPLPQADRAACEARMSGQGTTRGSVESGGIYRELTTREGVPRGAGTSQTPATVAPVQVAPVPARVQAAPTPGAAPGNQRIPPAGTAAAGSLPPPEGTTAPGASRAPGQTTAPGMSTSPGGSTLPGGTSPPGASPAPGTLTRPGATIPPGSAIPPHEAMPPRDTMTPQGTPRPPMPGVVPRDPVPGDRVVPGASTPQPLTPREPLPRDSLQKGVPPPELAPAGTMAPGARIRDPRQPEPLPLPGSGPR